MYPLEKRIIGMPVREKTKITLILDLNLQPKKNDKGWSHSTNNWAEPSTTPPPPSVAILIVNRPELFRVRSAAPKI